MAVTNETTDAYTIAVREQALDFMADYPDYGEQRWYSEALATEQVSFSWRKMPPHTGGRGSYGHRHLGQEEVYFVILGTVTFKVGDDVFEVGPQTAVRIGGDAYRSVHNDTGEKISHLRGFREINGHVLGKPCPWEDTPAFRACQTHFRFRLGRCRYVPADVQGA